MKDEDRRDAVIAGVVFSIFLFLSGLSLGGCLGDFTGRRAAEREYQKKAIEQSHGEFNQKTGKFQWKNCDEKK